MPSPIKTKTVEYGDGDTALEGWLAHPLVKEKRPGILIMHEWWGQNEYVRGRAEQLAELGYIALAADLYGKGVQAKTPEEAARMAGGFRQNISKWRERAAAGLRALQGQPLVDPKRIAVIGYCFGGETALELARSGADVAGIVSFHGQLGTPDPTDARNILGKILVCHGYDDPVVPQHQVRAFEKEMTDAGVDWQLLTFGGVVHSFTNPAAGHDKSRGSAYDPEADARSWKAMRQFFEEIFAS